MSRMLIAVIAATCCIFLASTSFELLGKEPSGNSLNQTVDFQADVLPIFSEHCYTCHSAKSQESNYRIDVRSIAFKGGDFGEAPIVPGKSAESTLISYVTGKHEDNIVMPPKGKGKQLTEKQVATLRAWIDQGAKWPDNLAGDANAKLTTDHWSFQPITRPALPKSNSSWGSNPIDAFILKKLAAAKLSPSGPADRRTLIRRVYLDMLGLMPTPEEVERFQKNTDPQAYEKLVERILASQHYGERWAQHWLDVIRFAESNGFETNHERPNAYHFRDFVIESLNKDKPFDLFIKQQISGDMLGAPVATGFLVGGPFDRVKSPDPMLTVMQRQDELADIVNTTGTAMLGLTMGCARCHNHKFDPILQKDYYAMQAVFAGVAHGKSNIKRPLDTATKARRKKLKTKLNELNYNLAKIRPKLFSGKTLIIDDETPLGEGVDGSGVILLANKRGHGNNPKGAKRGYQDDSGVVGRLPNVSQGHYTWWTNQPGANVIAYAPNANGNYRIWLSWGCGYTSHSQNAEYILDADGNLETLNDQTLIAEIDQQRFADGRQPNPLPNKPLWSGFYDAGVYPLQPNSRIVLRCKDTGTAITADVVVFQEERKVESISGQPRLRVGVNARMNEEIFKPIEAKYVRFTILATNSNKPCIDELGIYSQAKSGQASRNVALASTGAKVTSSGNFANNPKHQLAHINDGRYGNSHSWISNKNGAGWVEIELKEPTQIERIVWQRDREEKYDDRLATQYVIQVALKKGQWKTVASSRDRIDVDLDNAAAAFRSTYMPSKGMKLLSKQKTLNNSLKKIRDYASFTAYTGAFSQPGPTHRLYRGDPMSPKEIVAPDKLSISGSLGLAIDEAEPKRRSKFAEWIASRDNPLTSRVIVNRLWHYHFGVGIVDTPSDFGAGGTMPTHPKLLDWLASELMDHNWSLKHIHRTILLSSTYRQSNLARSDAMQADAGCRLLWRFPPRRIAAEVIRDCTLQATGVLDLKYGGPSFTLFQPNSNYSRNWVPKEEYGPAEFRRMIYSMKLRMERDSVFGVFDVPDGGQVCPKRGRSTTPLQALNLLNSKFTLQQAEIFSKRLTAEAGTTPEAQVNRAFALLCSRKPVREELDGAITLIAEHGLPAFCRAMLNSNEFLFMP